MQNQQGRPPSSLPHNNQGCSDPRRVPYQSSQSSQHQPYYIGGLAAHAITSALANPYRPEHYSYTNANYHANFSRIQSNGTTSQGYTLSSTYVANAPDIYIQSQQPSWPRAQLHQNSRVPRQSNGNAYAAAGDTRCAHPGCSFTGIKKTVEIHMMDRHLIFPPGWKKRRSDWDADPCLKGKLVPILGTGVTLDTPEAIDAWIAERKKKWPSNRRIEEKKRKIQEAADRGEIDPSDLTNKRIKRRVDHESPQNAHRVMYRGRGGYARRGGYRGRQTTSSWQRGVLEGSAGVHTRCVAGADAVHIVERHEEHNPGSSSSGEDTSDSGSDMDPTRDAVSSKVPTSESDSRIVKEDLGGKVPWKEHETNPYHDEHTIFKHPNPPFRRRQAVQPRMAPPNPFGTRSSLLRSLLLPEIRHTISNLSQAIHFLVENDFLEGVELTPGESESQPIKVLGSSSECSGLLREAV